MRAQLPIRVGIIFASIALLGLSNCATVRYQSIPIFPDIKTDKGLIYFYRESKFSGSIVSFYIYEGEERIGALKSGTYFFHWADPGEHTFWAKTESKSSRTLDVEPNETYYINGEVGMGFFVGRPELKIVHEIEGQNAIRDLKYAILPYQEKLKPPPEEVEK